MYIDRTGTRLESLNVDVDGYRNTKAEFDAVSKYNRGEEIYDRWERVHEKLRPNGSQELREKDWRPHLWRILYAGMVCNLRRWRRRRL
ncbi:MAG: hypothetical protein QW751_00025 [Candidatus Aenigmatarchaeota archaeon]|nr:hypothetical protein [Candidatus Aenigmarchaeota archaeon]